MPKKYLILEELPTVPSGKIDFRTTAQMAKKTLGVVEDDE